MTEQFHIRPEMIGYYDDPSQKVPVVDPMFDALCPYCGESMTAEDVRTFGFTPLDTDNRLKSCFYRTHKSCDEKAGTEKSDALFWKMVEILDAEQEKNHDQ